MPAATEAIGILTPIMASYAVFAPRRVSRGLDSMDDNVAYSAMNFDIAAGQVIKGARAAKALSIATNSSAMESIKALDNAVSKAAKGSKALNGALKVLDFTANNINPIICVAGGIKVLGSDDKEDAAIREAGALGGMFAFEAGAKNLAGMPYMVKDKKTGKTVTKTREALYKRNPFLNKQISAMNDFCMTKKLFNKISLKAVPGTAKGTFFVTSSILGYKAGTEFLNKILGPSKNDEKQQNK